MLWEVLRWNRFLATADPEAWKLNNNYHSRYARLLMTNNPELAGVFELRELKESGEAIGYATLPEETQS